MPLGHIEHGVQVAAFQEELAEAHRGIVSVGEEGVLDDLHPPRPPARSILMKCWRKRNAVSPVRMGKFCWTSLRSLPPKGGICEDDVVAVLLLDVGEVLGDSVFVCMNIRGLDAVQDQIHDRDDVGQRLLFLAVEGAFPEAS